MFESFPTWVFLRRSKLEMSFLPVYQFSAPIFFHAMIIMHTRFVSLRMPSAADLGSFLSVQAIFYLAKITGISFSFSLFTNPDDATDGFNRIHQGSLGQFYTTVIFREKGE